MYTHQVKTNTVKEVLKQTKQTWRVDITSNIIHDTSTHFSWITTQRIQSLIIIKLYWITRRSLSRALTNATIDEVYNIERILSTKCTE